MPMRDKIDDAVKAAESVIRAITTITTVGAALWRYIQKRRAQRRLEK